MDMTIQTCYVDGLRDRDKEQEEAFPGGEDSSYDSDFEGEEPKTHEDVSRTVSDTLAAEFSEYVSAAPPTSASYTAKVEFGLKLGYTEKLVQAALCKLGPNPSQNELLAELIKLGAQSPKLADLEGEEVEEVEAGVGAEEGAGGGRLRPIVVDGSNVAMSHGNKEVFSCRGIKICVDWFRSRGHREITVFVPKWRKEASRPDNPIADQEILNELEKERIVVFTPSRLVGGKRTICYDDRYVLRLAVELDGIVVSNDNYRDLAQESVEFRKVVEERTLMYSFVNDRFMPPDDPLGRSGPTLDNFLRIQPKKTDCPSPPCPYGKKCTYGNKCKYNHPERGSLPHKSVTERLVEHAQKHWQARGNRDPGGIQLKGKSLSLPLSGDDHAKQQGAVRKIPLARTKSGCPSAPCFGADSDGATGKSKSVENILNERILPQGCQSPNLYWMGPMGATDWQYAQMMMKRGGSHPGMGQRSLADPETPRPLEANLHRKLERQLTLNPYEHRPIYDPRRGYAGQVELDRTYWEHQNVTRISSAPEPCLPVSPRASVPRQMHRLSSTSDSQINLCVPEGSPLSEPFESGTWLRSNQQPLTYSSTGLRLSPLASRTLPPPASQLDTYSKEEARRKLHYHLSSIFPEEQVRAALRLYPNETKPQEICAAILSMFPKS